MINFAQFLHSTTNHTHPKCPLPIQICSMFAAAAAVCVLGGGGGVQKRQSMQLFFSTGEGRGGDLSFNTYSK